jgi:electron transport complex protein RnfC
LIGIEANKPEAISAIQAACDAYGQIAKVIVVPTRYPSGGGKQLIKLLTNKSIPSGVRSMAMGVQCFNVATVYSIYRALTFAEPVLSRIVTVTGNVFEAANFEVLLGTPLDELVWLAGPRADTNGYIMGGPMMGFKVPTEKVPISKASNCFIASSERLFPPPSPALPCIRCGKCAEVCPAQLQPQELYWFAKAKNSDKAREYALFDCIECGACAYVCPSNIPLVDYYRFAKSDIWKIEAQRKAADLARERHEFRQLRVEREKAEKAARLVAHAAIKQEAVTTTPLAAEQTAKIKPIVSPTEEEKAAQRSEKIAAALAKATENRIAQKSDLEREELKRKEGDEALMNFDANQIRAISRALQLKAMGTPASPNEEKTEV